MPLPIALAAPLVIGGLAYAHAKSSFPNDYLLAKCQFLVGRALQDRLTKDRLNFYYVLEEHALDPVQGDKPLLLFEGKRYTYREFYDVVLSYGHWLVTKYDVKPKQVVAINYENCDTFIIFWFALWSIGARPAFINYNLKSKPLSHSINASTARLCFVDASLAPNVEAVKGALAGVEVVVTTPDVLAEGLSFSPVRMSNDLRTCDDMAEMATLIFTSGTTGLPKPAVVSWRKTIAISFVASLLADRGLEGDIMYSSMPLYHSMGSLCGFIASVKSGSGFALGRKFTTKTFWDDVREAKATRLLYIGESLRYLLAAPPQYDPSTGECLDKKHNVTAMFGSGLRPDVWTKFRERFGIDQVTEMYGATEGVFATFNRSRNRFADGAIGRGGWLLGLLYRQQSAVVAVDWEKQGPWRDPTTGLCRKVKTGERGELLARIEPADINSTFQGYFNNSKATNSKVLRNVFKEGDAFFSTGDVVWWDEHGMLHFSDRLGDTFRWKGENVSTAEVSHVMGLHPTVLEANVYGVQLPHHDGRAGCVAVTFATPEPDAGDLRRLAAHLRESLPKYAVPQFLRIVKELGGGAQKTGTNKQQKQQLREDGVKPPSDSSGDQIYWLQGDTYIAFDEAAWNRMQAGNVKL